MGAFNMFSDLKSARDVTKYTLFRGTTDWTQLQQFDMYESGFPYLIMVSVPDFIKLMADKDSEVNTLVNSYRHIIENEFLGLESGIEDIGVETQEITNNIQTANVITKVNAPSATSFSMRYREKAGAPIEKMHELYLRSISDPATTFKTYNGLIGFEDGQIQPQDAGFHKECFSFLYMHTDNTGLLLERAIYWVCCQPTSAQFSIFSGTKGTVEFQDITVEFNGIPLINQKIDAKARKILDWMNNKANENMVVRNSWNFDYEQISDAAVGLSQSRLVGG